MDLPRLLDFFQTSELHFTRLDKLDDPYEHGIAEAFIQRGFHRPQIRYVNCWCECEEESAAMWSIYGGKAGVAVQSSRSWLNSALRPMEDGEGKEMASMGFGSVSYHTENALNELLKTGNEQGGSLFFVKRSSFSHEREVRFVYGLSCTLDDAPASIRMKVDLKRAIEKIYVAPEAPSWIADVVRRLVAKYDIGKEVIHSELLSFKLA